MVMIGIEKCGEFLLLCIDNSLNIKSMTELYFEEPDIEGFVKKLEGSDFEIEYVNEMMEHSWGQKVVRFYDPDGNLIEVGTPVN